MSFNKRKLIAILGPTGSGKTSLALKLAVEFNGEIINADSRAVYRGFDIGTAKPTLQEQELVPHHLLDIVSANEDFSLGEFKKLADEKIHKINKRGRVPFLTGGTMQYLSAVIENWDIPEGEPDHELRSKLEVMSKEELQKELKKVDPESFKIIDIENPRRLVRALEVVKTTGESFVAQRTKSESQFDILILGVERPREELYVRIDKRVDEMLEEGLEEEVKKLSEKYGWGSNAMGSIGYREFREYFEKCHSGESRNPASNECKLLLGEVAQQIKFHNHAYVRKQEPWFKKMHGVHRVKNFEESKELVRNFLNNV